MNTICHFVGYYAKNDSNVMHFNEATFIVSIISLKAHKITWRPCDLKQIN
jgi:hypothetical protein